MSVSIHALAIEPCISMLETLAYLLKKAGAQRDMDELLRARLAPDMFPLRLQVQLALHQASEMAARLLRETPPTPQTPKFSAEGLQVQIAKTIAYLRSLRPGDFAQAVDLQIVLEEGVEGVIVMPAIAYARDWALPNFYFHVVTAYDILRHAGVQLGKADFLVNVERYRIRPVMPLDDQP